MSIAALIRRMSEAGATPEAIALAVEAIEAIGAKDAERKAKQRERTAKHRAQSRYGNVTVTGQSRDGNAVPSSPLGSPPSSPQTPNQPPLNPPTTSDEGVGGHESEAADAEFIEVEGEQPEAKVIDLNDRLAETPTRGTRLPADWQPNEKLIATARLEGLTDAQIERELARFRDHWLAATGRNATKRDWGATFRNWVREAADRQRRSGRSSAGGHGSQGGSLLRAYQRAAARFNDPHDDAQ